MAFTKPKAGDRLVITGGLASREIFKLRQDTPQPVTVMKVGRVYFYVAKDETEPPKNWLMFQISDWRWIGNQNYNYRVFPSIQACEDDKIHANMRTKLYQFFAYYKNTEKIDPNSLTQICEILQKDGLIVL